MANNYVLMSTAYPLEPGEMDRAREVMAKACIERAKKDPDCNPNLEEENPLEGWGTDFSFDEDSVWFRHDESADPDFVADMITALQQEFHKPTFVFCFCFMCSKARVGEFGGGACAVLPDGKQLWCDPETHVKHRAEMILKKRKQRKDDKKRRIRLG